MPPRRPAATPGGLEFRLASTRAEVRAAQGLRYRAFFGEGGATPDAAARLAGREICPLDLTSDHLVVFDHDQPTRGGAPACVGAARLIRAELARQGLGFSGAGEFDLDALAAAHPRRRLAELSRFCVAPERRGKGVLELLWQGVAAYARRHAIDVLMGCASLPGVDVEAHRAGLAYLMRHAGAPHAWRAAATGPTRTWLMPDARSTPVAPDAWRALPPLLKAYWRLGARFSPEAVIDARFGVTDVFVVLDLAQADARYLSHFGGEAGRRDLAA